MNLRIWRQFWGKRSDLVSVRESHVQRANFSVQFCVRNLSGIVQCPRMFDYMANPVRRLIGLRGCWGPARRQGAMLLLRA